MTGTPMRRRSPSATAASALAPAAVLAVVLLPPLDAGAYSYQTCNGGKQIWERNWTNMYISTTSFPPASSWDARLQNAMWHWNQVKGSRFTFYFGRDTDGRHGSSNGVNEIHFDNTLGGGTLAVTRLRYNCSQWFDWWSLSWKTRRGIIEADIGFNTNKSWNTGAFDHRTTGSPYSFESIALHELGHALGLNHEDRSMATMNSYYPNSGPVGQWKEWDPLGDDRQGVRFLYPDGATEIDVVSSVFRRTGAGSSGLVTSPTLAAPGSSVDVQFTFGNFGTRRETFDIGFYLSPDDRIDSFDIRLGTNFGAWAGPGVTATHSRRLTIPSGIAPGTYWLGVVVDDGDAVAEEVEGNNGVAMPRPTTVGRGAVAFGR